MREAIKITFIGDVLCDAEMSERLEPYYDARTGGYDFKSVFAPMKGHLSKSDYVFANLETPLSTQTDKLTDKQYEFCSHISFAEALKGIGVLWKRKELRLKPLIYGSQQNGILGGTENVVGIASLGKAVEEYDYSSISSAGRNYVYHYISKHIPDSFLVGAPVAGENRLPCNLCMCFRGVEGESLMSLLDVNGIRVSTGSACNNVDLEPSHALSSIGMKEPDIHSCIRMSFCGRETPVEISFAEVRKL